MPTQLPQTADTVAGISQEAGRSFAEVWAQRGFAEDLVLSLVAILAVVLARWLLLRVVDRKVEDVRSRYTWGKVSSYVAFVLAFVAVAAIWLEWVGQLGALLGLLAAGLAIALKDPVVDLAGWIFIVWRRPFELGDRIQIGGQAGDVIDIRPFQFTILEIGNWVAADQSTGRIIHIPNAKVFSDPLANYTAEFEYLWNEVPVLVTFESDWRRAKQVLEEIAHEHAEIVTDEAERALKKAARRFMIFYQKLTPVVYTTVKDSGILLTIRHLCKPRQRRGTSQQIWESILDRFDEEPRIELAYPTSRVFFNPVEGKEEAREELPPMA